MPYYDCGPYETVDGMSLNLKIVYTKVHPQQYVVGPVLADPVPWSLERHRLTVNDVSAGPRGVEC